MPHEAAVTVSRWFDLPSVWQSALVRLGLAWVALIALFISDWAAMVHHWWDSSTYNHILLIPFIVILVVAMRARDIVTLAPQTWWPGLVLSALAAFIWLLGAFAGVDLARHLGAVALLVSSAVTLLGPRVSAGLAFPLCYMMLLVPFGDDLVPMLQMITAKLTIMMVDASGIPAQIDGVLIDTPAGLFEVAEACSGVKFLIAMLALGLLIANLCFVSWKRRALFMLVCAIVPVIANAIRAWGTIQAAQIFGIEAAAGFDHIVYGWVFFAVVLTLVIAASWRFFDRPVNDAMIDATAINRAQWLAKLSRLRIAPALALGGLALIAVGSQGWARAAEHVVAPSPPRIDLPQVEGWTRVDIPRSRLWEPRASGADHRLLGRYRDSEGREVDVFFALYSHQDEDSDAGAAGEGAVPAHGGWTWLSPGAAPPPAQGARMVGHGRVDRLAYTWYRSGPVLTGSNVRLKLANMADRLFLRPRPTLTLILSAPQRPGYPAASALNRFARAIGPIDQWMDRVAGLQ